MNTAATSISCILVGLATAPFVAEDFRAVIAAAYILLGGLGLIVAAIK